MVQAEQNAKTPGRQDAKARHGLPWRLGALATWRPLLLSLASLMVGSLSFAAEGGTGLIPRVDGEVVHADLVEIGPLTLRDAVGRPEIKGRELVFSGCQARAYLGTVTGIVAIGLSDSLVRARIDLAGGDLDKIVRQFGANPDGLGGQVDGWLEFTVPAERPDQLAGRGAVTVAKASLVQLPLLASLLVGDPAAAKGQDLFEATFEIREGKVRLTRAMLTSPSARVELKGSVGLDGECNLLLSPAFSFQLVDKVWGIGPLVAPMLSLASSKVARAVLRGQISDPVLVIDPFGRGLE
jgi:hypothetical protein